MVSKSFVQERGLKPSEDDGKILEQIRQNGWALLVSTPLAAPMAVVREFYANARETQNGISYVRGKQVSYSKEAIIDLFRLPTPTQESTRWTESQRFRENLDTILAEMCKPGTQWKTKVGTNQKIHFPQTALSRYAKAWYAFICASLLPTSHHQDVTVERAVLLYHILKGRRLDVGHLLHQSMLRFMRTGSSGGIPHASIITRLCYAAKVDWGEESLQLPMRDIDSAAIRKYAVWNGGESHPRGLGFILPDDEESEEDDANEGAHVEAPPDFYSRQEQEMRRLQRRMDAMHTSFSAYSADFSGALSQAFGQLGVQAQFPVYGSASIYPPPDTPPEQEEEGDGSDSS